jgi:hypothetical protein
LRMLPSSARKSKSSLLKILPVMVLIAFDRLDPVAGELLFRLPRGM